jgi:16S rRNA (uracil1498-N3)-methyltransferase
MQLFYNPTINETATTFVFDKDESKHIIRVLRKKENDILHVTNGLGLLFTTQITIRNAP